MNGHNKKSNVIKYKSLYTGKSVTVQQFLVESLYANNKVYDISKYMAGSKYRLNQYKKTITIISRLVKKIDADTLLEIILRDRVKNAEELPWRVEKIEYLRSLENLPKDYSDVYYPKFNPGKDLRDSGRIINKKKKGFFGLINNNKKDIDINKDTGKGNDSGKETK